MKKLMFGMLPPVAVAGTILLNGCAPVHHPVVVTSEPVTTRTTRTVVVTEEPPPEARTEVVGPAPSESQVWVQGYWARTDNRWVWMPGHWETRPRMGAAWVPGHWDKNPDGRGWIWTQGHWE